MGMHGEVLTSIVLAGALVMGACGDDGATEASGPTTTAEPSTTAAAETSDPIVGCPSGPTFPLSAVDDVSPVSEAPAGVESAMRAFLDDEEGAFWPQDGWQALHQTADQVLVVHVGDRSTAAATGLSFMTIEADGDVWRWAGASAGADCPLQIQLDDGLGVAQWELDPDQPVPGPDDTTVSLLVTERGCASGQPMGDRLNDPVVVADESQVSITFSVVPLEGGQECPGNPSTEVEVQLDEPLADRRLVDGREVGVELEDLLAPD